MSKSSFGLAVLVALLFSSSGYAGFTVTGGSPGVFDLGEFSLQETVVNRFIDYNGDGSKDLVTYNGSEIPDGEPVGDYTQNMGAGTYRVALIDGSDSDFQIETDTVVEGVIASNALWTSPTNDGFNVWGQLAQDPEYTLLRQAVAAALGVAENSSLMVDLLADGIQGTEIADGEDGTNPDVVRLSSNGSQLDFLVNSASGGGKEYSLVFTAAPEPGTIAVWALCGLCGTAAGRRRRLRKANAA